MDVQIKRVTSGINGLDDLIEGGFPEGSNILVTGGPGTGKSIMGLQFLVSGALANEPGIYLTFEAGRDALFSQALLFGWNAEKLEKDKKLYLHVINSDDIDSILDALKANVKQIKAKRVVVDSLSMMSICLKTEDKISKSIKSESSNFLHAKGEELNRAQIALLMKSLGNLGTTNLIIAEDQNTSDRISEFAADGVIKLQLVSVSTEERTLQVKKMRNSRIDSTIHSVEFTNSGLQVVSEK